MQRRYRQKKYHCGEYVEVAIYPVYTKAKGRGKRCKPTSEIQKRLNQRHAEGKLRRLLHTNFTDADCLLIFLQGSRRRRSGSLHQPLPKPSAKARWLRW